MSHFPIQLVQYTRKPWGKKAPEHLVLSSTTQWVICRYCSHLCKRTFWNVTTLRHWDVWHQNDPMVSSSLRAFCLVHQFFKFLGVSSLYQQTPYMNPFTTLCAYLIMLVTACWSHRSCCMCVLTAYSPAVTVMRLCFVVNQKCINAFSLEGQYVVIWLMIRDWKAWRSATVSVTMRVETV